MPFITTCIAIMLVMTGPVTSSILNWRQEGSTDKSPVAALTSASVSSSVSPSAPATGSASGSASESASSASVTNNPERPVLASPTNSTTSASPASSTATQSGSTPTATGNSTLSETNDPTFCHREYKPGVETNPFCTPVNGSSLDTNASYKVTWDATNIHVEENITIMLHALNETANVTIASHATLLTQTVNTALGFTYINTTAAMLNGSTNATLFLSANGTYNGEPQKYRGPLFYLLDKTKPGDNSTTSEGSGSSSDSSSSKQLGKKVGIPVGLIFFLIILAALAFFLVRYRRNAAGYATGKSLGQRTNTGTLRGDGGGGGAAASGIRGHKRQESFHDEPTSGGVELQERNRGLTGEDNWAWGRDSLGSPVSPISPTGNQFRDELQRQKTEGRR